MYVLDIETLSVNQDAVVLSIGVVYIEYTGPCSWDEFGTNSLYIKLDAKDQIKRFNRKVSESTLKWWQKQVPIVRDAAIKPSAADITPEEAFDKIRTFVFERTQQHKIRCYTRGSMDVIVLEHLAEQCGKTLPWKYNDFRDVRTFVDCMYEKSEDGYIDVDPELCYNFNSGAILKHHPVEDCRLDAAMMLFGKR